MSDSLDPAARLVRVVVELRAAGCVFAEEEAALLVEAAPTEAALRALVGRRSSGEPLEHLLGWAEFCGLRIAVEPGVFVPRRRTGLLVREATSLVHAGDAVLDLCCGSGAVGTALANAVPGLELSAADLDSAAVRSARRNLEPLGGRVYEGDLFAALPLALRGRLALVVCNAPYVPTEAIGLMPPEARDHEAPMALDGGPDGLEVHRRVAAEVGRWLAPGGSLLIETSARQAATAAALLDEHGLSAHVVGDTGLDATAVVGRLD